MEVSINELKARLQDSSNGGSDELAGTRLGIPEQIKPTLMEWVKKLFGVKPSLDELAGALCAGLVGGGLEKIGQKEIISGAKEIISYWEEYDRLYGDDSSSHKPHFKVGFVKALLQAANSEESSDEPEEKNPGKEVSKRGFKRKTPVRGFRRKG